MIEEQPPQGQDNGDGQGMMFGNDMRTEDEKLTQALEMAFNEISKDKEGDADDAGNTTMATSRDTNAAANQSMMKEQKRKGPLGTNTSIKLPFIIGTDEFTKHPFAGLVFVNMGGGLEQLELHKEEMAQIQEDKLNELDALTKNAEKQEEL